MTADVVSDIAAKDASASWRFCVAPMMDWTDRYCRIFHRRLSRRVRLYTEMVTASAILHGDRQRLLGFDPAEQPLALQLGGCDPSGLARAARLGEGYGYDEINLNCGCPSNRVQEGRFGAVLMREPERVAEAVAAMKAAVAIPVTVKCRIGVDDSAEYEFLCAFVEAVAAAGCRTFIVHARKAWLDGLSPKQNREIPPLCPETVHRLKREHPTLTIVTNGGLRDLDAVERELAHVDGVMLGREAYENPWLLADVDARLFGDVQPVSTRAQALVALRDTLAEELARGVPLARMTRHLLGLYRGQPGGRAFRRILSQRAHRAGAGLEVLDAALAEVEHCGTCALA